MTVSGKIPHLVIWDWNGTLQNDLLHIYECGVERIFRQFGLPRPTLEDYKREVTADFMKSFYWPHGIPAATTADDLNVIMRAGFKEKGTPPPVFPDALAAVQAANLRGCHSCLVSGYDASKLDEAVRRNGFGGMFFEVKGDVRDKAAEFGRILGEFADRMARSGARGFSVSVIGDTVEDAEAAKAVGARAFICPHGFHPRERIEALAPSHPGLTIIEDLNELLWHLP